MAEGLHDARRTYTFHMDDAVLDVFGPRVGAYGIAVYALLARHATKKEAFPSYGTMQKKLGLSRSSVLRTIQGLVEAGLILKDKRVSNHGDPSANLYTLVDLSSYHDHPPGLKGGSVSQTPPSVSQTPPSVSQTPGVVSHRHQGSVSQTPPLEGISLKGSQSEGEREPPCPPSEDLPPQTLTPDWLMLLYNQATPRGHPKVRTLSPARRDKAAKYLRIFPDASFWHTVMQEVSDSAFLLGLKPSEGHEGFVADFDWLFTKGKDGTENCLKVAEGKYRDGPLDGFSPAQRRSIFAAQRAWRKETADDDPGAVSDVFDGARDVSRALRRLADRDPPAGLLGTDA